MGLSCPQPVKDYEQIVMGHGSGGGLTETLIREVFAPAFQIEDLGDGAVLPDLGGGKLVMSTDSFVVQPLFFPGGDIGHLAVSGTVNDLAMMGAKPLYLSAGFILEEGCSIEMLRRIVTSMSKTALSAGVRLVTGDTKVVEHGHGDGVFINTAGIGVCNGQVLPHATRAEVGDVVIVNGTLGDHGIAILNARNALNLNSDIQSDAVPLNDIVSDLMSVCSRVHVMRDLTRGGLAAALNEIARDSQVLIELDEEAVPIKESVRAASEILGLDVLQIANEGKFACFVPKEDAKAVLEALQSHVLGQDAACVGRVVEKGRGMVYGKTPYGSQRVIDMPVGELLPRIC